MDAKEGMDSEQEEYSKEEGKEGEVQHDEDADDNADDHDNTETVVEAANGQRSKDTYHSQGEKEYDPSQPSGILNKLCAICQEIFRRAEIMFRDGIRQADGRFNPAPIWIWNGEIAETCHLCALLRHDKGYDFDAFLEHIQASHNMRKEILYTLETSSENTVSVSLSNPIKISISSKGYSSLSRAYISFHEDGKTTKLVLPASSMTWSLHSLEVVGEWLQTCFTGHSNCPDLQISNESWNRRLPLRLLDTGAIDSARTSPGSIKIMSIDDLAEIRVCRSDSLARDVEYLTLSHRWNSPQTFILENSTFRAFHESIPLAKMLSPEAMTFKNAIQVTRCLGFRYLWIDALCINQDDAEERSCEIAHMGDIYSNSKLNISATGASSPSDGLFFERKVLSVMPCGQQVKFCQKKKQIVGKLVAYTCRWLSNIDLAPLHTRGWVFQERILAPRILHFARDQIFWECASLQAGEALPHGDSHLVSAFTNRLKTWYVGDPSSSLMSLQAVREIWAMLVSAYSQTSLTLPQDKLVAFSAVARRFSALCKFKDEHYYAGLWGPDLAWQLLWCVVAPWTTNAVSTKYCAPSWSWASVSTDLIVWSLQERGDIVVRVSDVCVYTETDDSFGQIAGGVICLEGPMCRFQRLSLDDSKTLVLTANGRTYPAGLICINWDVVPNDFLELSSFVQQSLIPESLYCMAFRLHNEELDSAGGISGLILKPVWGLKGYYRRSGYFSVSEDAPGWDPDFRFCFAAGTLRSIEYREFDGLDKYTIAVI